MEARELFSGKMPFMKLIILLALCLVFIHHALCQSPKNQPITEGTISFETKSFVDWQEFDRLVTQPALAEIDSMEINAEEKEAKKKEYLEFFDLKKLIERLAAIVETMDIVFSGNIATSEKSRDGKKEDNFSIYQLDSMRTAWYYFDHKGVLSHNSITSTPEAAFRWSQITNAVRIDSTDTKEILGFPCVKYYVEHSHITDLSNNRKEPTEFRYELYVTTAIRLPFFLMDPAITENLFDGCALEIKYINDKQPYSYGVTRATAFSSTIDKTKLEIPARFKE